MINMIIKKTASVIMLLVLTGFVFLFETRAEDLESLYMEIAVRGFNEDIIANGNTAVIDDKLDSVTVSFDIDGQMSGNVFYSKDYTGSFGSGGEGKTAADFGGLPVDRKIKKDDITFTLQAYNQNNVLLLTSQNRTGTLEFIQSGVYDKILLLASSASGSSNFTATLNFSDGSEVNTNFNVNDWYFNDDTIIVSGVHRMKFKNYTPTIKAGDVEVDKSNSAPFMYVCEIEIPSEYKNKVITGITMVKSQSDASESRTGIFAVTGKKAEGTPGKPVLKEAADITASSFKAEWEPLDMADKYYIDVSETEDFSQILEGYNNRVVDGVYLEINGLDNNKTYYYRIRGSNENGQGFNSETGSVTLNNDDMSGNTPETGDYHNFAGLIIIFIGISLLVLISKKSKLSI